MAAWSTVAMTGLIIGPTVGGFLLDHYWWGSIFLVNVPIAAIAVVAAVVLMPESRGRARRPDPLGAVLSMIGMTAIVWAIISIPGHGWSSTHVLGGLAIGVLGLAGFALWERRIDHPMVPLVIFRDRNFAAPACPSCCCRSPPVACCWR